jgi:hypothetical protein
MQKDLTKKLQEVIKAKGRGKIHCVKDYASIGEESAITRAFSRMAKGGDLIRLYGGVYLYPKKNRFGTEFPSLEEIAYAIAERDKVDIVPAGVTAANALGLSDQVPTKEEFVTTGSSRTIKIGKRSIILKRQTAKYALFNDKRMLLLMLALKEIGENDISEKQRARIIELVLACSKEKSFEKDILLMPTWMRCTVKGALT